VSFLFFVGQDLDDVFEPSPIPSDHAAREDDVDDADDAGLLGHGLFSQGLYWNDQGKANLF
jgi:hypothetical protein